MTNGSYVNGATTEMELGGERVQIINDEKQFTYASILVIIFAIN